MATIRLVSARTKETLRQHSLRADRMGEVLVSIGKPMVSRDGVVVLMPARHRDTFIALFAAADSGQSMAELVDRLYRDDPTGGPDDPAACIGAYIYDLRSVVGSLGIDIVCRTGPRFHVSVRS